MSAEEDGRSTAATGRAGVAARAGRGPGVVFLGGFNSDMTGTKAEDLSAFCAAEGRAFLRFDYSGHGTSGGASWTAPIGRWAEDAACALDRLTEGPQVLVGSSMGGWIALLLALRRPGRVAALVGIAAAPDFTARIVEACRRRRGRRSRARASGTGPSEYGAPYPITRALLEEGERHMLLRGGGPIPISAPVRLLHGQRDPDVPWNSRWAWRRPVAARTCRWCW
jgi:pimeloyl-ACP methyl ester carboxylesterase